MIIVSNEQMRYITYVCWGLSLSGCVLCIDRSPPLDACVDEDGDFYAQQENCGDTYIKSKDCNDSDSVIYPGADEICDSKDNDCNGEVDEDYERYMDCDNDGYGSSSRDKDCEGKSISPEQAIIHEACPIEGWSYFDGDCNDDDKNINRDAAEIPGNDIDENCDYIF